MNYLLTAKMEADPIDVINSIRKLRQDPQQLIELGETRNRADWALREVEDARRGLEGVTPEKEKIERYQRAVNKLAATDWFDKGHGWEIAGKNKEAIGAFTEFIWLDPDYARAYFYRGILYDVHGGIRESNPGLHQRHQQGCKKSAG